MSAQPNQPAGEQKDMSFLEHLEELRRKLIWAAAGLIAGIVIVVIYDDFIINKVILGMTSSEFPTYKWLCRLGEKTGMMAMCFDKMPFTLQSTALGGNFSAYITTCITGGLVLGFPWAFYHIWMFVKPGLKQKEVKAVRGIVFYVSLLFIVGALFGYFILAPMSVQFLGSFEYGNVPTNATVSSYIKIISSLVLGTAIIFQLPILIYFLSKVGLVTAAFLRKYRRHAFVVNLILAAIITPPDVTSQILVAVPILLLYELSITIAARVEKKKGAE
ncbi:MAG: twin-arginine translocase subunit TatC [Flavobacteriales bacterium]|nr:twin-arginine translocase subunit TatC [Flavobacteriales bacterium]